MRMLKFPIGITRFSHNWNKWGIEKGFQESTHIQLGRDVICIIRKPDKYQYGIVFCCRPIVWAFRKNWYSLYRSKTWNDYPQSTGNGQFKVIDIGMFTIGINRRIR
jgi:hypothetical protein